MKTAINLLPQILRRQQMARRRAIQWSAVACLVLATIWIGGWIELGELHSLNQKLEILTREHRPNHAMLQELVSMRGKLDGLSRQETIATELEQQRHILTLLGLVSQSALQSDGKLRVTDLRLVDFQGSGAGRRAGTPDSSSLLLSGQSLDNPSVAELLDRLQDSRLFTNVELISLKERQSGGVIYQDYEVRCEM
jgi:Tfp pilus assembly protein PilN